MSTSIHLIGVVLSDYVHVVSVLCFGGGGAATVSRGDYSEKRAKSLPEHPTDGRTDRACENRNLHHSHAASWGLLTCVDLLT